LLPDRDGKVTSVSLDKATVPSEVKLFKTKTEQYEALRNTLTAVGKPIRDDRKAPGIYVAVSYDPIDNRWKVRQLTASLMLPLMLLYSDMLVK